MPQDPILSAESRLGPLKVARPIQKAIEKSGEWKPEANEGGVTFVNGLRIPATAVYEPKDSANPLLAVLSTTRQICKGQGACLSPDGRVIFLGEAELDSQTFIDPKTEKILPPAEREKRQLAVVRLELTLAKTHGDIYKAHEAFLTTLHDDKAPKPKEILQDLFAARSLEDYFLSALCYGEGNDKRSAEYLPGGKSFGEFVKNKFKDAKVHLSRLVTNTPQEERQVRQAFEDLVEWRKGLLNPESPEISRALDRAASRYKDLPHR